MYTVPKFLKYGKPDGTGPDFRDVLRGRYRLYLEKTAEHPVTDIIGRCHRLGQKGFQSWAKLSNH